MVSERYFGTLVFRRDDPLLGAALAAGYGIRPWPGGVRGHDLVIFASPREAASR